MVPTHARRGQARRGEPAFPRGLISGGGGSDGSGGGDGGEPVQRGGADVALAVRDRRPRQSLNQPP